MSDLSRRRFLRAGGVFLALPFLESFQPRRLWGDAAANEQSPQRMVLIQRPLGTYHPFLVPEQTGPKYVATRYMKEMEKHREHLTLFSGISHVGYPNSHHTDSSLFTGVSPENVARSDDIHNTISLDQVVAEKYGHLTRFPSLTLNWANCPSLSWNQKGVPIPWTRGREEMFRKLFINGTPEEVAREVKRLELGRSILDGMRGQLKSLAQSATARDKERLEVLTVSIREAEKMLHQDGVWVTKPKPKVDRELKEFQRADHWVDEQQQWYALMHLALQTDSTRAIVIGLSEHNPANVAGLELGHHDASHHGKDPAKIEQFARYEEIEYRNFAGFLDKLTATSENGATLLDRTQVLIASNLGDASAHSGDNLPVILAGGGLKHQGHVGFDTKKNYQLSNLYVRMLQQMGIETDKFGSNDGVLTQI